MGRGEPFHPTTGGRVGAARPRIVTAAARLTPVRPRPFVGVALPNAPAVRPFVGVALPAAPRSPRCGTRSAPFTAVRPSRGSGWSTRSAPRSTRRQCGFLTRRGLRPGDPVPDHLRRTHPGPGVPTRSSSSGQATSWTGCPACSSTFLHPVTLSRPHCARFAAFHPINGGSVAPAMVPKRPMVAHIPPPRSTAADLRKRPPIRAYHPGIGLTVEGSGVQWGPLAEPEAPPAPRGQGVQGRGGKVPCFWAPTRLGSTKRAG